jgi:hypothetical protein
LQTCRPNIQNQGPHDEIKDTASRPLECIRPRLFLFSILAIFCAATIHKATLAVAPPVYDAVSYYWKAISSLRALQAGDLAGLMAATPGSRPPGFLLLNGVFGIERDVFNFRGFLALNMILPVLLWALACWIAIPLRSQKPQLLWRKSIAVAALSLLPMFLQFEYNEKIQHASYWGLQDTILAATAALAIACLLRSLQTQRLWPCVAGFALAGFSILIKPSGALVMLSATGMWCAESFLRWIFSRNALRRRKRLLYFAKGIALGLLLQSAFLLPALFSPYLSKQIIQASLAGQAVVLEMMKAYSTAYLLGNLMQTSIGSVWALVFLIALPVTAVALWRRPNLQTRLLVLRLVFGGLIFAAATYWWLRMAGPVTRYMLPFVTIPIVLALPAFWVAWIHAAPKKLAKGIAGLLCAIACFQATLVAWPVPVSKKIQEAFGVSLGTGGHTDSVAASQFIVASSQNLEKPVMVLRSESHYSLGFIAAWILIKNLENGPIFQDAAPFEWKFDNVLSKSQLLSADFIAMDKTKIQPLPRRGFHADSFAKEVLIFNSWLAALDEKAGVTRTKFGDIEVLRVLDRVKLGSAFNKLLSEHGYRWRAEFLQQNADAVIALKFQENLETALSADSSTLGGIIGLSHDLEKGPLETAGECVPTGIDPLFCLSPFSNSGAKEAILHIEMSSTASSGMEVFYCRLGDSHSAEKSLQVKVPRGDSVHYLKIPLEGAETSVRIDPPSAPVRTLIKRLSIKRVGDPKETLRP